jgi:hypothetical protein
MEKIKQKLFGLYPDYVRTKAKDQHERPLRLMDYLRLRSIDDLTDEEKQKWLNMILYPEDVGHRVGDDYLRAIGIALPFGYLDNGEFKVMSVEEQVKNRCVVLEGK